MKKSAFCLVLAVGLVASVSSSATAQSKRQAPSGYTPKQQAVYDLVQRWGPHVAEAYRLSPREWAMEMVPLFRRSSVETLRTAASARTFDAMNDALLGNVGDLGGVPGGVPGEAPALASAGASGKSAPIKANLLGDVDKDLIFVPITPCRIIDTRIAGGQIPANTTRGFDITAVSNYSFQGGDSSNCGGAGAAGSFAAAVINFTVVTPSSAGYMTAFPFGGVQPLAATVNYNAGDVRGNLAVVRLDQTTATNEMTIYTFAQTHVVADLVGYFTNPGPLVFECVNSGETIDSVNAGATRNTVAPTCPLSYTQTATNCESSTWQMPFVYFSDGTCSAQNNSSGTAQLRASRTCCRARRT